MPTIRPKIWESTSGGLTGNRTTSLSRGARLPPTTLQWINELYYRETERKVAARRRIQPLGRLGRPSPPDPVFGRRPGQLGAARLEVKLTAASGNAGCHYWAHDIGGFRGDPNPELTVRWTQFGALSAAQRVHSTKDARLDRRPWLSGRTRNCRHAPHVPHAFGVDALHLQQRLADPLTMVPLNRPMHIDYGHEKPAYENPQEFLRGQPARRADHLAGRGLRENRLTTGVASAGDVVRLLHPRTCSTEGQVRRIAKPPDEFLPTSAAAGCRPCNPTRLTRIDYCSPRRHASIPHRAMPTTLIRSTRTTD